MKVHLKIEKQELPFHVERSFFCALAHTTKKMYIQVLYSPISTLMPPFMLTGSVPMVVKKDITGEIKNKKRRRIYETIRTKCKDYWHWIFCS